MGGSGFVPSGRGGAGNFQDATKSPKIGPQDLETPTLKTSVVTTGRGGTGNMQKNTDPAATRGLQDVEPVTRRESSNATHIGRGGGGNVFNPKDSEAAKAAQNTSAIADDGSKKEKHESLKEKGKEWLGLNKK